MNTARDNVPLTLNLMRADLAEVLHMTPEEIGTDDNLMDLGLDSMRAMSLFVTWSASGIHYDFSEFAADLTLAGWWAVVSRRQTQAF
jgi:aryl carrier-like protein